MNLQALSEERDSLSDDCDSGNDEPSDYFPLERGASNSNTPQVGQHLNVGVPVRLASSPFFKVAAWSRIGQVDADPDPAFQF
jgi:hypothetical protein